MMGVREIDRSLEQWQMEVKDLRRRVTVQTGLNLMRQIDYKHGTTCECSWGFPGGID